MCSVGYISYINLLLSSSSFRNPTEPLFSIMVSLALS